MIEEILNVGSGGISCGFGSVHVLVVILLTISAVGIALVGLVYVVLFECEAISGELQICLYEMFWYNRAHINILY